MMHDLAGHVSQGQQNIKAHNKTGCSINLDFRIGIFDLGLGHNFCDLINPSIHLLYYTDLPNNPVYPVVEEAEQDEGNDPLDEEPRPVDVEEDVVLGQSQLGGRREGLVDHAPALGVVQGVHYELHLEELRDVEYDGEHEHGNDVVGDAAHRTVGGGTSDATWN